MKELQLDSNEKLQLLASDLCRAMKDFYSVEGNMDLYLAWKEAKDGNQDPGKAE